MLDVKLIRDNPEDIKRRLNDRLINCDEQIDRIMVLDALRRELIQKTETAKSEQNKVSKEIPQMKKQGLDTAPIFEKMNVLKEQIKASEQQLREVEDEYSELLLSLPNLPDGDLKPGGKENNTPLSFFESKFQPEGEKNHFDLCSDLGIIDYERGAKLAGSGFWIYRGLGARLEWALLNFFIENHSADGYEFMMVPHMLNYECGLAAGQFPKFKDDVYWLDEGEENRHFMLPTAETALAGLHRDEILTEASLPRKYVAYSPCFRREAGSYRSEERGTLRGHQFNKVEMFQVTAPEKSMEAFEELVVRAENLVRALGLKFRTVKLAAGDCSASMARTYDIEVYIPSIKDYKEVSSVSNARDYQARRGNIRFRREDGKIEFCHTLNGSGLATSRVLPAIVEQYQLSDGSIMVPEVLRRFLNGRERISKDD
ncbi:MAG: serine--tRNA ligase [Oscillospiraceae bacterium]|jgi:seryl-tRNA synthetase|nr:serine--tRNA ligase [Oscillospiraceae bacterium]